MFLAQSGKNMREKMQCSARTDAVQCKGGCTALRERLQCTASEMAPKGTEIVSPFSGYLHRNNTGLARVHYIYVQLSEESSPQKKTSSHFLSTLY